MSESQELDSGLIALTNRTADGWIANWKKTFGNSPMNKIAMAISLERVAMQLRQEVAGQKPN